MRLESQKQQTAVVLVDPRQLFGAQGACARKNACLKADKPANH